MTSQTPKLHKYSGLRSERFGLVRSLLVYLNKQRPAACRRWKAAAGVGPNRAITSRREKFGREINRVCPTRRGSGHEIDQNEPGTSAHN